MFADFYLFCFFRENQILYIKKYIYINALTPPPKKKKGFYFNNDRHKKLFF